MDNARGVSNDEAHVHRHSVTVDVASATIDIDGGFGMWERRTSSSSSSSSSSSHANNDGTGAFPSPPVAAAFACDIETIERNDDHDVVRGTLLQDGILHYDVSPRINDGVESPTRDIIERCAVVKDEEDAMKVVETMGSPASKGRPTAAMYPIGCPVWFDVRRSMSMPERILARAGIVRKSAFDEDKQTFEYEVETTMEGRRTTETTTTRRTLEEGEIAYAVRCPVLVKRLATADGGGSTANVVVDRDEDAGGDGGVRDATMVGVVVDVVPAMRGGVRTFVYSVLASTNYDGEDDDDEEGGGGRVAIERDVASERLQHRITLESLQYYIREVSSSHRGRKKTALGIRSDGGRREPMRNGKPPSVEPREKKKREKDEEETSIVSSGRMCASIVDATIVASSDSPLTLQSAVGSTDQGLPPSHSTPSPVYHLRHRAHQGSAISKPITTEAIGERRFDAPSASKNEIADEWRMHRRLVPNELPLRSVHSKFPQVSGKKGQMIFPDKLHLILSMPVYSHVRQ